MFHAISARLARLARQFRDRRLLREQRVAAVNGWQVQRVAAATYQFRDPRFDVIGTLRRAEQAERNGDSSQARALNCLAMWSLAYGRSDRHG